MGSSKLIWMGKGDISNNWHMFARVFILEDSAIVYVFNAKGDDYVMLLVFLIPSDVLPHGNNIA